MRNVKMRHIRLTMRCCRKAADDQMKTNKAV